MKKIIVLALLAFSSQMAFSQNFITLYTPGYQLSHFSGKNVRFNSTGEHGDLKGGIGHILFKGDGIANNLVFGIDVSGVMVSLVRGLKNPSGSYYANGIEFRLGGAFNIGDKTKIGAGYDLAIRGLKYDPESGEQNMTSYESFATTGITFVGLHSIDEFIYIMPKLSFDVILDDMTDKPTDGLSTKFETSIGLRLLGNVGITITPGFEHLKFNIQDSAGNDGPIIGKSVINFSYLHVGFAFALD